MKKTKEDALLRDIVTPSGTRGKIMDLVLIALFAVIIALCSWLSVPLAVPFTMQTFGVFLAIGLLGGRRGTLAVLVYLLLGAVGLPVFAGFSSGIGVMLGSTGGYLVGFVFIALVYWLVTKLLGRHTWSMVFGMVLGLLICYAFGTIWFMAVYARQTGPVGAGTALAWCVLPFLVPDLMKMALALILAKKLPRYVPVFH